MSDIDIALKECGKCASTGKARGAGRKFWALLICLLALFVCGIFDFDITMAVVGLYGLYVGGNVSQKVGMDFAEHGGGRKERDER